MKIKCKGCNSSFIISDEELALVKSGDIKTPDTCDDCLEGVNELELFGHNPELIDFSNADKLFYSKMVNLLPNNQMLIAN